MDRRNLKPLEEMQDNLNILCGWKASWFLFEGNEIWPCRRWKLLDLHNSKCYRRLFDNFTFKFLMVFTFNQFELRGSSGLHNSSYSTHVQTEDPFMWSAHIYCLCQTVFTEWQTRLWIVGHGQGVQSCFCSRSILEWTCSLSSKTNRESSSFLK